MKPHSPIFKTAEGEARHLAAYDEALDRWPKPYDQIDLEGRFGCTHINAAGPEYTPPLFLLPPPVLTSADPHPGLFDEVINDLDIFDVIQTAREEIERRKQECLGKAKANLTGGDTPNLIRIR